MTMVRLEDGARMGSGSQSVFDKILASMGAAGTHLMIKVNHGVHEDF